MFDQTDAIRVIEDALDHEPFCAICGRPTMVRDVDDVLYLSCPAAKRSGGLLARLSATLLAHTDRRILDLRRSAAA